MSYINDFTHLPSVFSQYCSLNLTHRALIVSATVYSQPQPTATATAYSQNAALAPEFLKIFLVPL